MLVFPYDDVIGRSLRTYGEWAEHELACLRPYVSDGATVVDVGANVGTHTLAFAQWVGGGSVVAVEAQPLVCGVLAANCLMNARWNVEIVNAICARHPGWAQVDIDYTRSSNIGAISFSSVTSCRRGILKRFRRPRRPPGTKSVPVVPLDTLLGRRQVNLLKVDVEGMEFHCLDGARRLLNRCRPVVFLEQLDASNLPQIFDLLSQYQYTCYWLETHPFNQTNFRHVAENLWYRTESGILGLPHGARSFLNLPVVNRGDKCPPSALNAREGISVC